MPAYKNKENGSWYVVTQYTDWTGERKPKCKLYGSFKFISVLSF